MTSPVSNVLLHLMHWIIMHRTCKYRFCIVGEGIVVKDYHSDVVLFNCEASQCVWCGGGSWRSLSFPVIRLCWGQTIPYFIVLYSVTANGGWLLKQENRLMCRRWCLCTMQLHDTSTKTRLCAYTSEKSTNFPRNCQVEGNASCVRCENHILWFGWSWNKDRR